MGKIVASENVTLGGVVQDPAGARTFGYRRLQNATVGNS
jgi:hypothetical protein